MADCSPVAFSAGGVFLASGTVFAAALNSSVILNAEPAIANAKRQEARNRLPGIVVLAVSADDQLLIFAADQRRGTPIGSPLHVLTRGSYRTSLRPGWFLGKLALQTDGLAANFETKQFPLGPNRHNRAVAQLIDSLGGGGVPGRHAR